jgi:large subunit ribosomal protein L13
MNTRSIKKDEITEKWYVIDAKGLRLGKIAAKVATLLMGKNEVKTVSYLTPQNKIIILNSKLVDIHPRKVVNKMYYRHSGFIGGLKEFEYGTLQAQKPNYIIEEAIKGMLPKTKQRAKMFQNLFVYEGDEHKHEAQKPEKIEL